MKTLRFEDGSVMQSNSEVGDRFIQGYAGFEGEHRIARQLFLRYLGETRSILYWHIHDGWVTKNFSSGNGVLTHDDINLTWIDEHAGWSHTNFKPKDGERIAIIKDSPDGGRENAYHNKPFTVHVFEAKLEAQIFGLSQRYNLHRVETFKCVFEAGKYVDYIPPIQKRISKLKRFFTTTYNTTDNDR